MFHSEPQIGYIQGRLSPIIYNRIQCFPVNYWREELYYGSRSGFSIIEWTVDSPTLPKNPILEMKGQLEIKSIFDSLKISIPSVTCDFFMENPPWKKSFLDHSALTDIFDSLFRSTDILGPLILVVPLVDNSSITDLLHFEQTLDLLQNCDLDKFPIKIAFESDFEPRELTTLILELPERQFGINLDLGNSAALGFVPEEEVGSYGKRIINVHVKDRLIGGTSVHFGTGNTDFNAYLRELKNIGYSGNYILQSQRSVNNQHLDELRYCKNYVETLLAAK